MRRFTMLALSTVALVACGPSGTTMDVVSSDSSPASDVARDTSSPSDVQDNDTLAEMDSSTPVDASDAATPTDTVTPTDTATPVDVETHPDAAGAATFTQVYAIISRSCSPCHTTSTSGGLSMSSASVAYMHLVGVPAAAACASTGLDRVTASDADHSVLYRKVSGTMLCGSRMPLGRTALPAADIATIRQWINAGALND